MRRVSLGLSLVFALAACGSDDTEVTAPPTYYETIKPIVDAHCAGCHQNGEIAPFALTTYDEVKALAPAVKQQVVSRAMPPWSADPGHHAFRFDPSLSDEQIALIEAWIDAGSPAGDPAAEGAPLEVEKQKLTRSDFTLAMDGEYTPTTTPDEYRCFILDWTEPETVWVTGFDATPGNPKIDHHIAAYLVTPDNPLGAGVFDSLAALDAADEKPGYECFGGPSGDSELPIPAAQLGQWVPGQGGGDFPAGTGIEVPAGSKVVLQMHYNLNSGPAPDLTKLDIMLGEPVDRPAAFAPWLNTSWVFGGMEVPAGNAAVVHELTGDPRGFFKQFIGNVDTTNGFLVHAIMIHMHKLGVSGEVAIERADGSHDTLLSVSRYDFNWQRLYQLAEPVAFHDGDELTVRCHWDNGPDNQPIIDGMKQAPRTVNWGEGTGDEMCVGNLYISEM
jgi:mono/diheme cytochrome c family protein